MPHMIPQYSTDDFAIVTDDFGESDAVPAEACFPTDYMEGTEIELVSDKWFCRLSAPGYTDATDWAGPFDTQTEARNYIVETYGVNPETGEELEG